jgi:uncharacterized protein (TIGR03437 family)
MVAKCLFPLLFSVASPIFAQPSWDTSGNRLLNGAYNFREVAWAMSADNSGNFSLAAAQWGTITFDGNGHYTLTSTVRSSAQANTTTRNISGTYTIGANGQGFVSHTLLEGGVGYIDGMVAQGVFVGSSTESLQDALDLDLDNLNDLFIAAPAGSSTATNAALNGSYWVAEMNFPTLTTAQGRNSMYQATFNGQGAISAINATGYLGNSTTARTQAVNGATYSFTNGVGTLAYGGTLGATTLLAGNKTIYAGPDGNIFFGGSQSGYDMVVGIKAASGNPSSLFKDLWYQAGVDMIRGDASGPAILNSYYGSFKVTGTGIYGHERIWESDLVDTDLPPYNFTSTDFVDIGSDGRQRDFLGFTHAIGVNGTFRVGFGEADLIGLNVAVKAPAFSGTGVYVDPTGVVNGGSFAPFTVGGSPGALMTIFGTGLASAQLTDGTFPTTLGGVRVMINSRPAPIYVVSQTQISFVMPWATTEGVVEVQVLNNGVSSNKVTVWNNPTTPGIFTVPPGGSGYAAALHANYNVVTKDNPARPGEVLQVYLTGLGAVSPTVADGAPGPVNPLSLAQSDLAVIIDGATATVSYKGLAPQLTGLYQINVQVPTGTTAGDRFLDISMPDSFTTMVVIPVTGGAVSDSLGTRSTETKIRGRRPRPLAAEGLSRRSVSGGSVQPRSRRN